MSRIRSVKPEFWTDSEAVACSPLARLLFIGCWNHADDYGVLKDDPERLRLQILPADQTDAEALVDELVKARLLVRMTAPDGTDVLVIRTFTTHQKIDRRSPGRYGLPCEFTSRPGYPTARVESPPIPTLPDLGLERTGPSNDPPNGKPSGKELPGFEEWWQAYPRKIGKADARTAYRKALKEATPAALLAAIPASIAFWEAEQRPDSKIPYPATWLNRQSWLDELTARDDDSWMTA